MRTGSRPSGSAERRSRRLPWSGRAVTAGAVVLAVLLAGRPLVPGSTWAAVVLDSAAPWIGVGVPVLAAVAVAVRSSVGGAALVLPALVWAAAFGPALVPHGPGGAADLRVATHNLRAGTSEGCSAVSELAGTGADLVALQELTFEPRSCPGDPFGAGLRHQARVGTVGLWSRYPITRVDPIDTGLGWRRALRADVATPHGPTAVYVVHLPSLRPGAVEERDRALGRLAGTVRASGAGRVLVLGDFNTAGTDRRMRAFAGFPDAQETVGGGFGFTWPATFPLVRLDHILYRGLTAVEAAPLRAADSDHRAATAAFRLD